VDDLVAPYLAALFGEHARRGPAWLYVQDHGPGLVSFVGASRTPARPPQRHPLRYGSDRPHQFVVGEVIVRPRLVVATSTLTGDGLASLATGDHNLHRMLTDGEVILGEVPA
jgi:hypothetical protein